MLVLAAIFAVLMGVVVGLLGGGGSILTVPMLVYGLGLEPGEAIATSLLIVGVTAVSGAWQHARRGSMSWPIGALFGASAMAGAYAGGLTAAYVRGPVLLLAFATMMGIVGVMMLRPKAEPAPAAVDTEAVSGGRSRLTLMIPLGLGVGFATGMVGAGGGFLVVPALVAFGRLEMRLAIGTSLFVVALNTLAGFLGHIGHAHVDYVLAGVIIAGAVVGSWLGARLAHHISQRALRSIFAWFVLGMAIFIASRELPSLL